MYMRNVSQVNENLQVKKQLHFELERFEDSKKEFHFSKELCFYACKHGCGFDCPTQGGV